MKYIIPEYYNDFKCKCGNCRFSCCDGWPIRISMQEYHRLLGIECSDFLRDKLDCALKISPEPNLDGYAIISTDWLGVCKLHREDGYCALQAELGEDCLPEVCRLYPRNTKRLTDLNKCSCSNSCEAVVELLLDLKRPMQFLENDLPFKPVFKIDLPTDLYNLCRMSIAIIQDRSLSLPDRLIALGNYLNNADLYKRNTDHKSLAFQVLLILNNHFSNRTSISEYCDVSLSYYGMKDRETLTDDDLSNIFDKYLAASVHLETTLPEWQVLFEQLIVNHLFYNDFPYIDFHMNVNDAYLSLVLTYSFMRFHFLGVMSDTADTGSLVDLITAMFRLIEHSDFRKQIVSLFKTINISSMDCIPELIYF